MKVVKGEEILLITENKIGRLEEVTKLISRARVNIRAVAACVYEGEVHIRLITSDNAKAKESLKTIGKVEPKEVIIVELPDEVGQLNSLAAKLKVANIDLRHLYGTTFKSGQPATIVFSSNNNDRALEIICT